MTKADDQSLADRRRGDVGGRRDPDPVNEDPLDDVRPLASAAVVEVLLHLGELGRGELAVEVGVDPLSALFAVHLRLLPVWASPSRPRCRAHARDPGGAPGGTYGLGGGAT